MTNRCGCRVEILQEQEMNHTVSICSGCVVSVKFPHIFSQVCTPDCARIVVTNLLKSSQPLCSIDVPRSSYRFVSITYTQQPPLGPCTLSPKGRIYDITNVALHLSLSPHRKCRSRANHDRIDWFPRADLPTAIPFFRFFFALLLGWRAQIKRRPSRQNTFSGLDTSILFGSHSPGFVGHFPCGCHQDLRG